MPAPALSDTFPWLAVGSGEPLVVLPGLARGPQRSTLPYAGLARVTGRQIHVLNRPLGLARGISMPELASLHAAALVARFPHSVDLMGASTGGAIALQLAVDHPHLIRRLVIATAASWLGEVGRQKLRAYADEVAAGRSGAAILASVLAPPARQWFMRPLLELAGFLGRRQNPDDMLATIDAEASFDVTSRLGSITAPTLLIAGGRDHAFPLPLVEATAAGIPNGRLIVYPEAGHLGAMLDRRFGPDVARFLAAAKPSA
jgi:pimeloyl-ACP methyl ester carboxylesterase